LQYEYPPRKIKALMKFLEFPLISLSKGKFAKTLHKGRFLKVKIKEDQVFMRFCGGILQYAPTDYANLHKYWVY